MISGVGQADDVLLLASTISDLHLLATLTEKYCQKCRVKLGPSKTKLFVYPCHSFIVDHAKTVNPITIGGVPVKFTSEAEHVGIIRNTAGNMPNLLNRISNHKKNMGAIISAGLGRRHRGNPAAAVRVHNLYCTPVLFSGLASLVLSNAEVKIIDLHYQITLQNLQRLHQKTPRSVVLLLAGSLPGEAILHIRQLTLFSMKCHLPDDHINSHAKYVLASRPASSKSWFHQIRDLCLKYSLPHPIHLLENPPPKSLLKAKVKSNVSDYWKSLLTAEAAGLKSLTYLRPSQYNLKQPALLWLAASGNSFECAKSTIVAKMISGRYRSEDLCKHWSTTNKHGHCLAPTCTDVIGDLEHMLVVCPALQEVRGKLTKLWLDRSTQSPALNQLIKMVLASPPAVLRSKYSSSLIQ